MQFQRGIALVQVLIITLVLSTLGLYIIKSSREQVATTFEIKEALSLRIKIENTEARVINALLSQFRIQNVTNESDIAKNWNFYNKPFEVEGVSVQLQDLNGLISLNVADLQLLKDVLMKLNVSPSESDIFIDSLADWKDENDLKRLNGAERAYYESQDMPGPRNGYLQSLAEVSHIRNSDILTPQQWSEYFTVEHITGFNPANAPEPILQAFIKNDTTVANLVGLRDNARLNGNTFYRESGIEPDEFINFLPGDSVKVTLTAKKSNQRVSKSFTAKIRTRSLTRPIVITNVIWNQNEVE
ncbi:general secretion pathway protein GspK [Pseudoalteromonas sp. SSMSWG5]|uniref:general secretion pathway protein GspK n=1 Tax=Pseudoalteromonas sp. SSMSWG5 TaxID=3139396 RepID=UPI003BA95D32